MSYDIGDVYYVARHRYAFRCGEPALVLGVTMAGGRPCLDVIWRDGYRDYAPLGEMRDGLAVYELVGVEAAWGGVEPQMRWLVEWWSLDKAHSEQHAFLTAEAAAKLQAELEYHCGHVATVRRLA